MLVKLVSEQICPVRDRANLLADELGERGRLDCVFLTGPEMALSEKHSLNAHVCERSQTRV
eukprot:NODE_19579_length_271_cov_7.900901_g18411_i0.p1 GENE.NODE_19579_length_271_cov_7.900901_g18411_i0~~NODE_19579_length_271_cov_7.900901_g18411_i0.p1  ORF type:complete len:61 (+),score=2.46 NODE_19579_length_271_cov_7.900901_g18411_i0:50-232(+)